MNMIAKSDSVKTSHTRVLVVDDHPGTADMLARAISQLGPGIQVLSATSGKGALEIVKDGSVDLLITDLMMPGMNGLELIENLRAHPAGRPSYTILITAYDVPGFKETARRLRVNETVLKPFRPERICQIVSKALEDMGRTKPVAQSAEARQPFKILIADDIPDNVALLSRYLQNEGCAFVPASDGVEALEKIRSEMPDLILLDINMPGKDGFEVLKEIRSDPEIAHLPVIFLTAARPDPVDIQTGLNLGADDYIIKPFDRRELMARIHTKLRVKEAEDAIRRRNRELSVLLDATRMLNSRGDLDQMLEAVLHSVVNGLGAKAGYLLNFENSMKKSFPASSAEIEISHVKDFLSQIYRMDGARIIDNVQKNSFWQAELGGSALSAAVVSISGRLGSLLGAILLTHESLAHFKPEHISILQAVANQIAVAIENAGWYAAIRNEQART